MLLLVVVTTLSVVDVANVLDRPRSNVETNVNFKANLIASRKLFHINRSPEMTDHFSRLMVRGACSIKIGMDKNYLNILEVRVRSQSVNLLGGGTWSHLKIFCLPINGTSVTLLRLRIW